MFAANAIICLAAGTSEGDSLHRDERVVRGGCAKTLSKLVLIEVSSIADVGVRAGRECLSDRAISGPEKHRNTIVPAPSGIEPDTD